MWRQPLSQRLWLPLNVLLKSSVFPATNIEQYWSSYYTLSHVTLRREIPVLQGSQFIKSHVNFDSIFTILSRAFPFSVYAHLPLLFCLFPHYLPPFSVLAVKLSFWKSLNTTIRFSEVKQTSTIWQTIVWGFRVFVCLFCFFGQGKWRPSCENVLKIRTISVVECDLPLDKVTWRSG